MYTLLFQVCAAAIANHVAANPGFENPCFLPVTLPSSNNSSSPTLFLSWNSEQPCSQSADKNAVETAAKDCNGTVGTVTSSSPNASFIDADLCYYQLLFTNPAIISMLAMNSSSANNKTRDFAACVSTKDICPTGPARLVGQTSAMVVGALAFVAFIALLVGISLGYTQNCCKRMGFTRV